jgi:hypothetical protein
MEEQTPRGKTPVRTVRSFIQDAARQFSPRHSATSISSVEPPRDSVSSLSERRSSERTPNIAMTEWPGEVLEPRPFIARHKSVSTDRTLTDEPKTDWRPSLTRSDVVEPKPGERMQPKPPRGIVSRATPAEDVEVIRKIEQSINYHFCNPELLLEALESPDSGVVCVGEGNRPVPCGNKPLAKYGKTVMEMALMKQFYLLNIPTCKQNSSTHATTQSEDYLNADLLT